MALVVHCLVCLSSVSLCPSVALGLSLHLYLCLCLHLRLHPHLSLPHIHVSITRPISAVWALSWGMTAFSSPELLGDYGGLGGGGGCFILESKEGLRGSLGSLLVVPRILP